MVKAAIGLCVITAIVAAVMLTRPSRHSGPPAVSSRSDGSGGPVVVSAQDVTGKLVYGMTKREVLGRIGKPTKTLYDRTAGLNCWQYTVNQNSGRFIENAVRVCFVEGGYSVKYYEVDGKWVYIHPKIGGAGPG